MITCMRHVRECKTQSLQLVRDFVSTGLINLDAFDKKGLNPLHVAVKNKKQRLAELLLESGAFVNGKTKAGETALSMAICNVHPEIVKILLNHNASLLLVNRDGKSALRLVTELSKRFNRLGFLEKRTQVARILDMIMNHGINSKDDTQANYYRLCKALITGDLKSAKRLIRFTEDVNFNSIKGESPLEFALYFYRLEEAELLLEKGANPNQNPRLNRESALVFAIEKRSLKMVRLLLKFDAEVNFNSSFSGFYGTSKRTPLLRASHLNNFEFGIVLMRELLNHGAEVSGLVDDVDIDQQTALHVSCYWGFVEAVQLLISHSADVNCRDAKRETPLHKGVEFPEIVKILLERGAEVNATSLNGSTPLHRACSTGSEEELESIKLLVEYGADVNATDDDLETPLHYACGMCNGPESIKFLAERGAKLTTRDVHGRTILHRAAENYELNNLKCVIDLVVPNDVIDVNTRDNEGNVPLHYVYDEYFSTCGKFVEFLKNGGDHNVRSKNGDYPFHVCWEELDETQCLVDEYVQRLNAIGYEVLSDDTDYGVFRDDLAYFYRSELEELKKEVIVWNPRASLYDLLFAKRKLLARYSDNENLKRAFADCGGDFETRYPYFGSLLNVQYRRALHRKNFTRGAKDQLVSVLGKRVPDICSDVILKYLNNSDLKRILT